MFAIEEIYDAAFDRARFATLIEQLVVAFGAQAGFIGWSDADRDAGFQVQYGNDPAWLQRYVETYAAHDLLRPHLHAVPEGVCTTVWPLLQQSDVQASVFYREFLTPQGIVDNLAVNLIKRPGIVAHLALLRHAPAGRFTDAECREMAVLVPHLRRAIYIQSHLVRAADRSTGSHALAGGAASSMLLLTADRRLLEGDAALVAQLRLAIGEPLGDGQFGIAVADAIRREEPMAIELALYEDGENDGATLKLLIESRPLESNRFGDLAAGPSATHAIHVTRVDCARAIAFPAIGSLYGLTATELRVLRDAVETGDITAIGDRLGMARATARTHLHRIYEKTATRSFAGLSNVAHRFGRIVPK